MAKAYVITAEPVDGVESDHNQLVRYHLCDRRCSARATQSPREPPTALTSGIVSSSGEGMKLLLRDKVRPYVSNRSSHLRWACAQDVVWPHLERSPSATQVMCWIEGGADVIVAD